MIFISTGFDAHRDDATAMLDLVETDYAWVTERVRAVAERHAPGQTASALEGRYHLAALARSVAALIPAMGGT